MKECKHEIWGWRLIPDQVNTNYQAVYCDLCDEQLAHVGSPNKTVTETVKPQPKEKVMKQMTDSQIKYIRSLFIQVKEAMTIDEQDSLVTKMKAHIDGTNVLTTVWASTAIAKLKTFQGGK